MPNALVRAHLLQESLLFVLKRLQAFGDKALLIDVGAGVGEFAMLAALHPYLRVHAFEPGEAALAELKHNVDLNGLRGRIYTYAFGNGRANTTRGIRPVS